MRKEKLTSETPSLGVRTRAKTLALQRLPEYCYLQLRSRRLEKLNIFIQTNNNTVKVKRTNHQGQNCCSDKEMGFRALSSGPIGTKKESLEDERFGENNLGFQPIQSAVRESTHSNLISDVGNISTPDSSTWHPSLTAENQRPQSLILTNIPSMPEADDLFAHFEQQQQQLFIEKYNFDIVNELPLPGRYEWVKVNP
ncbi:kinase inhibitor [Lithospermum erythrorhizon]|uniref:Cyclin-dependent kinase inhibitor n=1 Tax=Lithospermum erythrorhizon TaxID=34254 RepID=A0AAV3RW91_LITER